MARRDTHSGSKNDRKSKKQKESNLFAPKAPKNESAEDARRAKFGAPAKNEIHGYKDYLERDKNLEQERQAEQAQKPKARTEMRSDEEVSEAKMEVLKERHPQRLALVAFFLKEAVDIMGDRNNPSADPERQKKLNASLTQDCGGNELALYGKKSRMFNSITFHRPEYVDEVMDAFDMTDAERKVLHGEDDYVSVTSTDLVDEMKKRSVSKEYGMGFLVPSLQAASKLLTQAGRVTLKDAQQDEKAERESNGRISDYSDTLAEMTQLHEEAKKGLILLQETDNRKQMRLMA